MVAPLRPHREDEPDRSFRNASLQVAARANFVPTYLNAMEAAYAEYLELLPADPINKALDALYSEEL